MTAVKKRQLQLVRPDDIATAQVMAATPALDPSVPAVSPLSEYRADAMRRKMDAEAEIALRTEQELRADAELAEKIAAAFEKHDRFVAFETQKRDAARREINTQIEQYARIVDGAAASLAASDDAEAGAVLNSESAS